MTRRDRIQHILFAGTVIAAVAILLYSPAYNIFDIIHSHSYSYMYFAPRTLTKGESDPYRIERPAVAVPILMYHGVRIKGELGTNTARENFIAQMEMLKREGYETITVHEYDLFREGKFTLPSKPIIITFDDGRKDSYYTVDKVFKKLGFKATIFIATIKANEHDPFYLSWEELENVKETGRWEIEAHGRHSHDQVPIDENLTLGRYLTSREYHPDTGILESIEDFKERVREDYENGILDLIRYLNIDSRYYAVPLNDYGNVENSNYEEALAYNEELTSTYFKLAFVEAAEEDYQVFETFYNYRDSDPYTLKRLEVKNMSAEQLLSALEKFAPKEPDLHFPDTRGNDAFIDATYLLYGELSVSDDEILLKTSSSSNAARVLFGDKGWSNYRITAHIWPNDAREVSILVRYSDEDDLILIDWDKNLIAIEERINGKENTVMSLPPSVFSEDDVRITAEVDSGILTVSANGVILIEGYKTNLTRGAPGFGVWDPDGGEARISSLEVTGLN